MTNRKNCIVLFSPWINIPIRDFIFQKYFRIILQNIRWIIVKTIHKYRIKLVINKSNGLIFNDRKHNIVNMQKLLYDSEKYIWNIFAQYFFIYKINNIMFLFVFSDVIVFDIISKKKILTIFFSNNMKKAVKYSLPSAAYKDNTIMYITTRFDCKVVITTRSKNSNQKPKIVSHRLTLIDSFPDRLTINWNFCFCLITPSPLAVYTPPGRVKFFKEVQSFSSN